MSPPLLKLSHLCKSYGGVRAIHDISLSLFAGEVHALCGENGAGKSTIIKSLSGVVTPDAGQIELDGKALPLGSVRRSEEAGIAVIHQESTAFLDLNTIENLHVGRERRRWGGYFLDHRAMVRETEQLLGRLQQDFNIRRPLRELSVAQRQMVAMARALSQQCRVLILDEPTASLSARETDALLNVVRRLRDQHVAILYVSHRLEEIFRLADRVTVLRDGQSIATARTSDTTREQLIQWMVGYELDELGHRHEHAGSPDVPQLQVVQLTRAGSFSNITFTVHRHEIVGLAGLVGAGRSEVLRAIFGIDRYDTGSVRVGGVPMAAGNIRGAIQHGLALVPEDRQREGLILPMSVAANMSLAILSTLTRLGLVSPSRERASVDQLIDSLRVKASHPDIAAETLSGGNQQRLVLGKWLATNPSILLLDEPTRGIDVGAKAHVHQLVRQLAAAGMATLVVSSDIPELLTLCDRILVVCGGRLTGELMAATATPEQVLQLALPEGMVSTENEAA